ncbi:nuclear transport factor 2 family protein [Roseomonas mucosa]|uniref:nuclear transport factor 2 family protein n=1 Tax=Roseomonas mucosa TaxID=207340 RepID=UPI0028CD5432|nr:nuclear transport factor 2 family protein [Roseomonas mucosa]MDT8278591.1 nuclear transport factor 2 family protein [Roseomonas mucosa]
MGTDPADSPAMTREAMMAFAQGWIAAWNRRDVDAVLSHFADDAIFISPVAHQYVGSSTLHGKAALADYWRTALERLSKLEFTLDHATWDPDARELLIVYQADLNGERRRACELMIFDPAGRQIKGEAMYGAPL